MSSRVTAIPKPLRGGNEGCSSTTNSPWRELGGLFLRYRSGNGIRGFAPVALRSAFGRAGALQKSVSKIDPASQPRRKPVFTGFLHIYSGRTILAPAFFYRLPEARVWRRWQVTIDLKKTLRASFCSSVRSGT